MKIEKYEMTDIQGKPYNEYLITEGNCKYFRFSVNNNGCHKADRGYVLFDVEARDNECEATVYFGMNRKTARAFARKILEITE